MHISCSNYVTFHSSAMNESTVTYVRSFVVARNVKIHVNNKLKIADTIDRRVWTNYQRNMKLFTILIAVCLMASPIWSKEPKDTKKNNTFIATKEWQEIKEGKQKILH